jgi:BirA family biotin operon repressor/biotin-[acetyl-CoA-carboxylase] ligase
MDELTEDAIASSLTGRFGRPLRAFDSVASTNTIALEWASEGAPEGAIVVADHQTAGRGRWGRSWMSEPGAALQFSLILRPRLGLDRLGVLGLALGVAIAEGIEDATRLPTKLKWPNDVLVAGRKLVGILIETRVTEARLDAVIAGIGINVRWAPDENATSVAASMEDLDLGDTPARAELLARVLATIEDVYALVERRAPEIVARAEERSEFLGGEIVVRFSDGSTERAVATRLLPDGALEVETDGVAKAIGVAEVQQLRPA